jgi:hypothetical protein
MNHAKRRQLLQVFYAEWAITILLTVSAGRTHPRACAATHQQSPESQPSMIEIRQRLPVRLFAVASSTDLRPSFLDHASNLSTSFGRGRQAGSLSKCGGMYEHRSL